jgi:hypothetical protein
MPDTNSSVAAPRGTVLTREKRLSETGVFSGEIIRVSVMSLGNEGGVAELPPFLRL